MILEHAILNVKPGQAEAFEAAMREALPLISASDGFRGLEVRRCIESPDRYVLLVTWDSVEAHDPGFRGSDRYPRWKALLHHFYDPFPVVEHYGAPVATA
ncbi:antibiotic biosynthesis monooxygenase family protein [Microbaculum sp. FT89]|uniref:antibiotic biosynthesis monooxygenase family protein n=1 Tax=Microbaculum sp. FT89 TaxID=3447298 RepID=UPI003F53AA39